MNKIPMTVQGIEKLHAELKHLKNVVRPKIIYAIAESRKHGDLKENAEYHAAREEQAFCEKRIKEIESKLYHAQVIDIKNIKFNGTVVFGSTVSVLNLKSKQKFVFCIVGDDESNFKNGLISVNSPIARSLIGHKVSDVVIVNTPSGKMKYEILNIKYI
ncbi:transcription elongation factor GreA [Buchnera aphidicola]|uniref:Transcription elongation factor GreA n=1 Tax=Buchnera aphidicola (Sarucallis kahawaluokalani) TaxID=1241878 RepID=A0A4D6YK30_9GAMM|nr:transcription elongation factor GreA [Buchnera aphidicola]QCI26048.1 transcription elongation factor GreA [Buchnera aphidicola (Sarucallis kahawaluokalani)]